jgi:hypothetical protein
MNSLAIALATDSAASVDMVGGRAKLYQADKLFMLSHKRPVGVMVYGNSTLLGVPWETIVKVFRTDLADDALPHLVDYGQRFIDYLRQARQLFPRSVQEHYFLRLIDRRFRDIKREIDLSKDEALLKIGASAKRKRVNESELHLAAARKVIETELDEWRSKDDVECYDSKIASELATQLSREIHLRIEGIFDPLKLEAPEVMALREIAILMVSKDEITSESFSGVVIAGFGEDEHFPVMQSFRLGEIYLDELKYEETDVRAIDVDTPSIVQPFAEAEMVETFLNGISADFELKMAKNAMHLAFVLPEAMIDQMTGITSKKKEKLKNEVLAKAAEVFEEWREDFEKQRFEQTDPIRQSIAFLPKNELAHVAASLVNLNSFQKRMSIREDETVGGPIDVAVISKGDGFVWIERKHYFKPELNRHFFKNYGVEERKGAEPNDAKKSEKR